MQRVIALGFFDGVHIGHGSLLKRTVELAEKLHITPSVLSFDAPPAKSVELITSPADRAEIIKRLYGIDDIILLHFDDALRTMDWERFVEWLREDFGAEHLVAGRDFRFGYMGRGDAEKLTAKCAKLGIGCDILSAVTLDGETVSSTRIRALLCEGDIEGANRLLGHPYFVSGTVAHGRRIGHMLGVPTVNLGFEKGVLSPKRGVYLTRTVLQSGAAYGGVTNVGARPTVSESGDITVETNIFGFDGDLYGEKIRVEFLKFLRSEKKFPNIDELRKQIETDAKKAGAYFE